MTNLEIPKSLKTLKLLRADEEYVRRSRLMLTGGADLRAAGRPTWWKIMMQGFQVAATVALAGLLVLVLTGSFSAWNNLSPFRLSSLDPAALRAEAQAIDLQIHLTDVGYTEAKTAALPTVNVSAPASTSSASSTEPNPSSTIIDPTAALELLAK
ncbi:MAG TPA: hypothetical protein VMC43_03295 [Candidatus Paceibacterota bacterium]|nr:hypothetical protein [Candidatus Paceibacterota bacterium]